MWPSGRGSPVVHNPCPANGFTKRQEVKGAGEGAGECHPNLKSRVFGAMQRLPLPGSGARWSTGECRRWRRTGTDMLESDPTGRISHLDAPFHALPPEKAAGARAEQRELLFRLAELANRGGPIWSSCRGISLTEREIYGETLGGPGEGPRAPFRGQVFIAPGNPRFLVGPLPLRGAGMAGECPYLHLSRTWRPWSSRNWDVRSTVRLLPSAPGDRVLEGFHAPEDGKIHLLVLHADGTPNSTPTAPLLRKIWPGAGWTMPRWGHPCPDRPRRAGATVWAYPGCPEGRGFDELGDKGCPLRQRGAGECTDGFCAAVFPTLSDPGGGCDRPDAGGGALREALPEGESPDFAASPSPEAGHGGGWTWRSWRPWPAPYYYSVSVRDKTRMRQDLWARAGGRIP